MGAPAVALAPGFYRIPTFGAYVNSYAFIDDDGRVTLVDCGLARAPAKIVAALPFVGKRPADVTRILLTHAHCDHAGGAHAMVAPSSAAGVGIHAADAGFIRAGRNAPPDLSTTSGHSPGHVSLLHEPTGVLITGDAIFNVLSRLRWPIAAICTSFSQNKQSAHLLGELHYSVAAFTHGPQIRERPREAIHDFLRRKA